MPQLSTFLSFSHRMGTVPQLIQQFGSRPGYERAVHELQAALYQDMAG